MLPRCRDGLAQRLKRTRYLNSTNYKLSFFASAHALGARFLGAEGKPYTQTDLLEKAEDLYGVSS